MATRRTTPRSRPARRAATARRTPARVRPAQQDRGQKRIDEILDAAEAVIAKQGVERTSINAIARKAGSGMGSLYHFFPHKEAIVLALAQRYSARMRPLILYGERPEMAQLPLARLVDAIIDPLAQFFELSPAYIHVYHATCRPDSVSPQDTEMQELVVGHVTKLMMSRARRRDPARLRVSAMAAVEMVHGLLAAAYAGPRSEREALLLETKRMLALHAEMVQNGDEPLERLK